MFIDFLVRLSKSIFVSEYPFRSVENFEQEMFLQLLEHMEVSRGFMNFEKNCSRTHMASSTVMPRKYIIESIHRHGKEIREMEGIGLGSLTLEEQQHTTNLNDMRQKELSPLFLETLQYVIGPYEMTRFLVPYHLTQI